MGGAHVADESGDAPPNFIEKIRRAIALRCAKPGETNLVQHAFNAQAYSAGAARYDMKIQGCQYRKIPTSRYRVWCLEVLRREWAALDAPVQDMLKANLPEAACVLWDENNFAASAYDENGDAPFNRAINVYGNGVPGIFRLLYRRGFNG